SPMPQASARHSAQNLWHLNPIGIVVDAAGVDDVLDQTAVLHHIDRHGVGREGDESLLLYFPKRTSEIIVQTILLIVRDSGIEIPVTLRQRKGLLLSRDEDPQKGEATEGIIAMALFRNWL